MSEVNMKKIGFLLIAFIAITISLSAQDRKLPAWELSYWDDGYEITFFDPNGNEYYADYDLYIGDYLHEGWTIETGESALEIKLVPNGTILKIAPGSTLSIGSFQQSNQPGSTNALSLLTGKIRSVASKIGTSNSYTLDTPSAVCGVRGTDFVIDSAGNSSQFGVKSGQIDFAPKPVGWSFGDGVPEGFKSLTPDGNNFGKFNSDSGVFDSQKLDPAQLDTLFSQAGFAFNRLNPSRVVQIERPSTESGDDTESGEAEFEEESWMMTFLQEYLGFEIGTIMIDDLTYSKAVVSPVLEFGKLRTGLYLPIIYQSNMFDPDDWYKPDGNDEWSFGTSLPEGETFDTEMDEYLYRASDFLNDLVLKIKFIEWGDQDDTRDDFVFKVGNLSTLTIGHGILMRNYANDLDFPSVRKVGFYLKSDRQGWGFESVVNNLAAPEIFGGRLFFRPLGGDLFAVGIASIADIDPVGDLTGVGDPALITGSVDMEFAIPSTDLWQLTFFADAATMLPYFREAVGPASEGLYAEAFLVPDGINTQFMNYGIAAGVYGNIGPIDLRVEYRDYNGTFQPAFFSANYDRIRIQNVTENLVPNLGIYDETKIIGVYGEAGAGIFNDAISFTAGYLWPFTESLEPTDYDYIHAQLDITLKKGTLPFLEHGDLIGSIYYDRTGFVTDMINDDFTWVDTKTALKGELVYPVAPLLDIAGIVASNLVYDGAGNPKVVPSITIETRVSF
jgi:hypothetical protein